MREREWKNPIWQQLKERLFLQNSHLSVLTVATQNFTSIHCSFQFLEFKIILFLCSEKKSVDKGILFLSSVEHGAQVRTSGSGPCTLQMVRGNFFPYSTLNIFTVQGHGTSALCTLKGKWLPGMARTQNGCIEQQNEYKKGDKTRLKNRCRVMGNIRFTLRESVQASTGISKC